MLFLHQSNNLYYICQVYIKTIYGKIMVPGILNVGLSNLRRHVIMATNAYSIPVGLHRLLLGYRQT